MSQHDLPRRTFLKLAAIGAASTMFAEESHVRSATISAGRHTAASRSDEVGLKLGVAITAHV